MTPLGVAAAVGVTLYFIGAVISHLRVKDFELAPAAVLALVAAAHWSCGWRHSTLTSDRY